MRFPDDPELINAALRINLLFREAGRSPSEDWCSPIWIGRYLWDRFAGLDHETSIRKHEAELREALGLDSAALASQSSGPGAEPRPLDSEVVGPADVPAGRFPDDPELVNAALRINLLFREAGRSPSEDWCSPIWMGRYLWDRFAGLDHETSIRKHEAELRSALGLTPPQPQGGERGRIRAEATVFRDESSALWRWKGCTDFLLFKRSLDGEDIGPLLDDRIGLGANLVRVLGMAANIVHFDPRDYGSRYGDGLHNFLNLLDIRGIRCEFVVFADAQILMTSLSSQMAQLDSVARILQNHSNAFGELVNEYLQNGISPSQFAKPAGPTLWSRGSGGGDEDPALPPWDYLTFHPGRTNEWPRKMKSAREYQDKWHVPCVNDEPMGASDQPESHPGQRDSNPSNFFDAGACAALESVGATFHSDDGAVSQQFEPQTRACAQAFFAGMSAIPLEAQTWLYTRGGLSDCPLVHRDAPDPRGAVRTFVQYTDHEAWGVAVQRGPAWQPEAVPGWQIDAVNQSVVHLVR